MILTNKKPLILLTIDYPQSDSYSKYPWYAIRKNYSEAVSQYGGVPIILPCESNNIDSYLEISDGVMVIGGDFDIDPKYYGEQISSSSVHLNNLRTEFEFELLKKAIFLNKSILGICGGMQLLNVVMGGSLIQDIKEELGINHQQPHPKHIPSHQVTIEPKTILSNILEQNEIMVNSTHHQAVKKLGNGLTISAKGRDGIIEAIEIREHKFCLGVQWHPEYLYTLEDQKIIQSFIASARS